MTISPYQGLFSTFSYLLIALFLFGFIFVFSRAPEKPTPVDNMVIFIFICLLTSWLYFILTTVTMKQVIHLDATHLTVTKKMLFPLSRVQVGIREVHAIIIGWIEGKASAPIFIACMDREIVFAQWLHDSDPARAVYDRLAHRLPVKRMRRRLRPVDDAEPSLFGVNQEWVLEEFEEAKDEPGTS